MKIQNIGLFLFPFFAAMHLIYALTSFSFIGSLGFAAIAFMCVELITFWDNFIIAIGNRVGVGVRLERLNWARFFFHGTFKYWTAKVTFLAILAKYYEHILLRINK